MSDSGPLSEQQRTLLADRLFQAAVENALKAHTPPDEHPVEGKAEAAEHYARAALALTRAYRTVTQPCEVKR